MMLLLLLQASAAEADALVEKGDAEAVRAAITPETRFYAQMALDELEARGPKPKRVTVAWKSEDFQKAARELAEKAGIEPSFSHQSGEDFSAPAVSLELKDVTLAEAFARLADAGQVSISGDGKAWQFISGGACGRGTFGWRNTIYSITSVSRQRLVSFVEPPRATIQLGVSLVHGPDAPAACNQVDEVSVLEAVDVKGESLLMPESIKPSGELYSDPEESGEPQSRPVCRLGDVSFMVEVKDTASALRRLRGTAQRRVPVKQSELVLRDLDQPDKARGAVGPYSIAVANPSSRWGQISLTVRVNRTDGAGIGDPHLHIQIENDDETSVPYSSWGESKVDADGVLVFSLNFYSEHQFDSSNENGPLPKAVRITLVEEVRRIRSSFEFREVDLKP